jgi:radical SAM protein with 4Fe4S-binding SPASM domain
MIEYAREKNIYVWSSTNGHFLSEENIRETIASGLNKLVISLDGTDQETYQQYRVSGSYQKVVEGLRDFVRIRNEAGIRLPHLEIQFLVLKSNEHQIKEIKKLGNSLGVDRVVLKTAQFCDFEYGNPLMPEGRWSRYKRTGQADRRMSVQADDQIIIKSAHQHISTSTHQHISTSPHQHIITSPHQHFIIKHPLRNRCFRMWAGCVITWDGKVVPCCFDKDAAHALGDLNKQSFGEIWRGEAYRHFRHSVFMNRKSVEICRNCSQRW